ncbi:MAG: glycosyltransferase family 39 protein [Elusimicrobia bacterium]|nr:glycosyltransferase family 39 protein [Elusimicrobiota bacterium]
MIKIFNLKNTVIFVIVSVLWKLFMSSIPLHSDEAYYWLWSKQLALSYYDHAPMVAYFIKLTTLFGNSEIAVRFSSIIVTIILSFLLWKLVIKLFHSEAVASASIVILHSMPILFTVSIIITPDTPVFLFLSLATYFVWNLIDSKNVNYWYLIGLFFGLSMLSKYTACLFVMSLFIYMVLDKKWNWLKNYQLYTGIIISIICFLPVIYWNWQHDWASFSYQIGHGLSNEGIRFNYIFEYLGTQAGVFNVILFFPILYIGIKYLFSKDTKNIYLAAFSVPVILFYVITALKRLPGGNWPIPAYFTFSIIAAKYFVEGGKIKQRLVLGAIIFNLVVSVIVGLHAKYTILPLDKISDKTAIADATNYFHGYKELAEKLLADGYEFVVTPEHQLSSSIAYYTENKIKTFRYSNGFKKTQFEIWGMPEDFNYENGAFVYEPRQDGKLPCNIDEIFNLSSDTDNVKTIRNNNIARQYNIQKISK